MDGPLHGVGWAFTRMGRRYSLSLNDVEVSIRDWEHPPPHHPISGRGSPSEDKQFKDEDHPGVDVGLRRQDGENALVELCACLFVHVKLYL